MAEQITEEMKKCEQAYNQALTNNEIEKAIELCEKLVLNMIGLDIRRVCRNFIIKLENMKKRFPLFKA